jgi:hypothetical protein
MSSDQHHHEQADPPDQIDRYTAEEASELDKSAFDDSIGRRTFLSVAAATGAALALPSTVSAQVTDGALTDLAEYVVNATPDDYEATLVLEFADEDALGTFADKYAEPGWDINEDSLPPKAETRESPTPAAHAYLTADELADTLDISNVEFVDFSPGANPFWKLDGPYDDRVFPEVEAARDFVSHSELGQGLQYLEDEYPDRLRAHSIGQGPGWENLRTGEDPDRTDIYVAAVTADAQNEESFQEKDKAVFSLSIHGDEPAGRVGGTRLLEDAVRGEADAIGDLLDDIVVFLYVNPDGWVVRKPQYEFETWGGGGTERFRYDRGNGAIGDTNRQYPTMGWVNPGYWPAEPENTPEVRPDDPEGRGYEDMVPDALSVVEHFRGYDNVEYLCDYHGMDLSDAMTLNLETNAPFDHDGTHNLDEVNRRIVDALDNQWGSPEAIAEDTMRAGEDIHGVEGYVPDRLIDYGSIYDCLGYQITGGLLGWAGQPEEFGGLGAITVAPEMVLRDAYDFKPYIERHLGLAYRLSMEEFSQLTAADTDATIATGGQDTAYVASDALTRSSADLPFTDEGDDGPGNERGPPPHAGPGNGQGPPPHASVRRSRGRADRSGGVTAESGGSTHSLAAEFHAAGVNEGVVQLVNPGGQVVREADLADPTTDSHSAFYVPDPDDGKWTVEYDGDAGIDVETILLESEDEYPNPEETLGYSQRKYEVNPMRFFEDLAPNFEDGEIDDISVHHVSVGRLLRGRSGKRHYDNVVISHDDGIGDSQYVSEIERFVEAGGDLVLTDTGLNLLTVLDVGDTAAISADDIEETTVGIGNLNNRDFNHPLLTDIREIQQEVWKGSQLGYTTGDDSPVTTVDTDAFEAAGGTVGGTMGGETYWEQDEDGNWEQIFVPGEVGVGTLTAGDSEINVLGSVLPPANQRELHPFGMADYAVSFMGHTLVCNALGFEQRRYVNGELVGTWGEVR